MSVESENLMAEGIVDLALDIADMMGGEGDDAAAQPDAVAENHEKPDAVAANLEIAVKIAGWNPSKARVKLPEVACQKLFNEGQPKRKVLSSGKVAAEAFDADNFRYTQIYTEWAAAAYGGGDAGWEDTVEGDLAIMKLPLDDPIPSNKLKAAGELELLDKELSHSEVLVNNMIKHKETDTEVWFCCYKRNPDHNQYFTENKLVTSHISNDEPLRIVIAARGTEGIDDAITDLQFNLVNPDLTGRYASFESLADLPIDKVKVHSGFAEQIKAISNEIDREILQAMTKYHHDHSDLTFDQLLEKHPMMFTFVGHSMGGALARMFCFDYLCRNAAKGQGWTRLVTIGSAPTGNMEFASTLDKLLGTEEDPIRCLHVVNGKDPIPVSLDRWWAKYVTGKYEHCGTLVWLNEKGEVLEGNPSLKLCQSLCAHKKALTEHFGSNYIKAVQEARQPGN